MADSVKDVVFEFLCTLNFSATTSKLRIVPLFFIADL